MSRFFQVSGEWREERDGSGIRLPTRFRDISVLNSLSENSIFLLLVDIVVVVVVVLLFFFFWPWGLLADDGYISFE